MQRTGIPSGLRSVICATTLRSNASCEALEGRSSSPVPAPTTQPNPSFTLATVNAEPEIQVTTTTEPAPVTTLPAPTTTTVPATTPAEPRAFVAAGWPRGCTIPGTFNEGPCIPRGTCAIPERICGQEAGSINVWNYGGSGASGKYQAMPGTWGGYGGYLYAAWAPESVQDAWAVELWNGGRGCSHWAMC